MCDVSRNLKQRTFKRLREESSSIVSKESFIEFCENCSDYVIKKLKKNNCGIKITIFLKRMRVNNTLRLLNGFYPHFFLNFLS